MPPTQANGMPVNTRRASTHIAIGQIQQHEDQDAAPAARRSAAACVPAAGFRTGRPIRRDSGPAGSCTCSATLRRASATKLPMSRPRTLRRDRDPPLAPFARDRRWAFDHLDMSPAATAECARRRRGNQHRPDGLRAGTELFRQPHHQRKTQLPLDHFAQRLAADRFDQVEHRLGRHPVAGHFVLFDLDLQHRLAGDLLGCSHRRCRGSRAAPLRSRWPS